MRDYDIRRELDVLLHQQHAGEPNTFIRHEVGLCAGKRRVDVALLNGEFAGYEIKSDVDSLARLLGQASDYGQVLDRVTLVTTVRHLEKSMGLLPQWWGIMVARQGQGSIILEPVREAVANPELEPYALAQLLWRDEALEELKSRGLARGLTKKARHYLWRALMQAVPIEELRDLVRERVKARAELTGAPPHAQSGETRPTVATA